MPVKDFLYQAFYFSKMEHLISTYSKLGEALVKLSLELDDSEYSELIQVALNQNAWFTRESVKLALQALGESMQEDKISKWLSKYRFDSGNAGKTIGLVLAGNIPLVGLHDLLCVLISGNTVLAKLSSKDEVLYRIIKSLLVNIDSEMESRINFCDGPLTNIDAIIATGSDNSARYFEYYFGKYPNIIRKNRNSVAIISGNETESDLQNLGYDIFTYFGLGCRNVSFLLVPLNYNFNKFFGAMEKFKHVAHHNKYINNYEYQKAILMMNKIPLLDNGFLLVKEDKAISSPIGLLNYMQYQSENEVHDFIELNKHKIQCIVSNTNWTFNTYGIGTAQQPELWDYADNVDTLEFLLNLK